MNNCVKQCKNISTSEQSGQWCTMLFWMNSLIKTVTPQRERRQHPGLIWSKLILRLATKTSFHFSSLQKQLAAHDKCLDLFILYVFNRTFKADKKVVRPLKILWQEKKMKENWNYFQTGHISDFKLCGVTGNSPS